MKVSEPSAPAERKARFMDTRTIKTNVTFYYKIFPLGTLLLKGNKYMVTLQ